MVVVTERDRPFANGDLVEVDTENVRALARIRRAEHSRIHIALEQGQYLPWVEEPVLLRRRGDAPERATIARIVHTSSSAATLEVIAGGARGPSDTLPLVD